MYFDFNLPYTKNDAKNPNRLRLILARYSECKSMGFKLQSTCLQCCTVAESVVALNYTTDQCTPEQVHIQHTT